MKPGSASRPNSPDAVEIERHYYSVPYRFAREAVEARITAATIELFHKGEASPEDIGCRSACGLDRALLVKLVAGDWIGAHDNLVITGPTGVGKSWLACALGHKACRDDRSVLYQRVPKLFASLALARGDGRHERFLRKLGSVQLLILDDCWGGRLPTSSQCARVVSLQDSHEGVGLTWKLRSARKLLGSLDEQDVYVIAMT